MGFWLGFGISPLPATCLPPIANAERRSDHCDLKFGGHGRYLGCTLVVHNNVGIVKDHPNKDNRYHKTLEEKTVFKCKLLRLNRHTTLDTNRQR